MPKQNTIETLFEKNSIQKLVFRLGIPAMFGQFFNLLYSIVDRIFVGQIPSTGNLALASIGVCAPALTAITAFAYMVGIGGASCMSINLGQKHPEQAKKVIGNSLVLLLCISIALTVLMFLIKKTFLYIRYNRSNIQYNSFLWIHNSKIKKRIADNIIIWR